MFRIPELFLIEHIPKVVDSHELQHISVTALSRRLQQLLPTGQSW